MKKLFNIGLTSALVAGSLFSVAPAAQVTAAPTDNGNRVGGQPKDLGIVNQDRMIQALIKRGVIATGLTPEQQEKELNKYLQQRVTTNASLNDKGNALKADVLKSAAKKPASDTAPAPATPQNWDGGVRKDKLLVLLVEYSDFAHNTLTRNDTDFYYSDYSKKHYEDMLFSPTGYVGPDGKQKVSMQQYYLQQSGGSYTVEGDVYGWLKASKPAKHYGGNINDDDAAPRDLVREAIAAAAASGVDLSQYDQEDIYDLDGDGDKREPDGLVDHLMIVHAGSGEEAGGATLGEDAIWSHRWDLGSVYKIPGTQTDVPYWGGSMAAFDYTIQPEDGATGVFAHEYGHDLGLPDEYDTGYTGGGEPVEYWSIMSAGSWAGAIPGTEPTGFSPYAKEFFQNTIGGNWQHGKVLDLADIPAGGLNVTLDQASTHGANEDVVRIDLPDKVHTMNAPAAGSYQFWSDKGDEIFNTMNAEVDLTGATSATLDFDTWYRIEETWDYGFVQVSTDGGSTWKSLSSSRTRTDVANGVYPTVEENLPGYTGYSNGWVHETIDLSAYAGQKVQLRFAYATDWGTNEEGMFVDNVKVTANGAVVLEDGAEADHPTFALNGFTTNDGSFKTSHHYLVEWRNHEGVDQGLAHIKRGQSLMSYDPGMVIWYVNDAYDNNWVGVHPGYGYLGLVDAHQNVHHWGGNAATGDLAGTRYQIFDASFSTQKGNDLDVYYDKGSHLSNAAKNPVAVFDDKSNWWTPSSPYSGLKLPSYGLKIEVTGEAADRSTATIKISK